MPKPLTPNELCDETEFACLCGGERSEHEIVDESGASVCHCKATCPCPRFREHGYHKATYVPGAAYAAYRALVDDLEGWGEVERCREAIAIDDARLDLFGVDDPETRLESPHMKQWLDASEYGPESWR